MKKFTINGQLTVSCWTVVEAETKEEALEISEDREVADLCYNPFYSGADEAWHFEIDGMPQKVTVEE